MTAVYHDQLVPFLLNEAPVRGRVVRLYDVMDTILKCHDYPPNISRLLGEALVVASMLASNLKSGGVLTVQIQSKGAIKLLVVDAAFGGALRGYADFDATAVAALNSMSLPAAFGEGYLAITFDPGEGGKRYQGVVPLEGASITDAIQRYFTQSQQLRAQFHVAVGEVSGDDKQLHWIGGGVYIEHMPNEQGQLDDKSDEWDHASALLATVQGDELLDPALDLNALLHRLFHENGVWVYEPLPLEAKCRCSREKIEHTLKGMERAALEEMVVDGKIEVDCQFCNSKELFTLDDIQVA